MILLLDNYDSFTWNLFHYLDQFANEPVVIKRNDEISIGEADAYSSFVLSPGPGIPSESGILNPLIAAYFGTKPILGICLGMQAIAETLGGKIFNMNSPLHGVERTIHVCDQTDAIFEGIPDSFTSGHYHSWGVSESELPEDLLVTARDQDGNVMAIRHARYRINGLQFHPESVMTTHGLSMISNWLKYCRNQ